MDKKRPFFLGGEKNLSVDRVANLVIPLMSAVYAKQQLALQEEKELTLSQGFRAVVKDIMSLSHDIVTLDKEIRQKEEEDSSLIN